jgi:hypothetical protein
VGPRFGNGRKKTPSGFSERNWKMRGREEELSDRRKGDAGTLLPTPFLIINERFFSACRVCFQPQAKELPSVSSYFCFASQAHVESKDSRLCQIERSILPSILSSALRAALVRPASAAK